VNTFPLNSYPFDSEIIGYEPDGSPLYDRAADSAILASLFHRYYTDGIFYNDDGSLGFAASQGAGMTTQISAGYTNIQGRLGVLESIVTLDHEPANATYDRIDTIVLRRNLENDVRNDLLLVITGTPASSPAAPALTRNSSIWDLRVADIRIPKNSTEISQANITDTRLTDECGIVVTRPMRLDVEQFYRQIQADLEARREQSIVYVNEWVALVQNTLNQTTEGALLNLIKQNGFQTYAHSKAGAVHELTLVDGYSNIKFTATDRFTAGDTFTINGEAVEALMPDGNALSDGYFVAGAAVIGFREGNTVYFVGGGASNTLVTITLNTFGGGDGDPTGRTVTVTNTEDDSIVEQFVYDGQPHTVLVPVATRYKVSVDDLPQHVTPAPVIYTATANVPRSITLSYKFGTRYGFRREKSNSSPSGRISYLFNAVGMTPMSVNLSSGAPSYGSWEEFVNEIVRPVMLKSDGTVDYELDRNDQTKRADNGEASDVSNASYDGNAMVEFGGGGWKWVKRYEDSAYEYVIFCNTQFDDDYHAYAHTNANGEIMDAFYWGMFKGTYSNNKLRSIGSGSVMVETTRQQEIDRAVANGDGYHTIYKSGWDFIGDLLTLLSKSDNSQAVFGSGRSLSSNTAAIAVGSLKNMGAFWGSSNGTSDVKALFIEGFWGNVWEGMAGLILDGSRGIKTKMTPPYNTTGSGYDSTGVVPSGTSGGFVNTHSVTDQHGYVPKTANGSETTYMCDGLWFNTSQVDYALVGGRWYTAGKCGSRCANLNDLASYAHASFGSRLSFIPV